MLMMLAATAAAQPPFLFTPEARSIEPAPRGWRVDLGDGDVLDVTGSGDAYTARAAGLDVATYRLGPAGWREMPGGALWRNDAAGRWVRGPWALTATATGFRLDHPSGRTSWTRRGLGYVRAH